MSIEPPTLRSLDGVPDPRDLDGYEPGEVSVARIRGLIGEAPTWRTLANVDDSPPGPLILGMLETGANLLYGGPGVGKGSTVAHLCVEAQRAGMLPMVHDAEMREREYARRVSGLGGDRSRVVYTTPRDLGPRLAGRPLWEQRDAMDSIVKSAGVDIIFVDSILPAVGVGEERLRSDAQAPFLYVAALDSLGIPTVSLGHPPKGQPEGEPFGSMAWLAAMRLTWLGTKAKGEGHRVRWRPRKRNERGFIPGVLMTFGYGEDGRLASAAREDDEESTRNRLLAALVGGPRSVADLAEEWLADEEEHVTADRRDRAKSTLARALNRMAREGTVVREGRRGGPGVKWGLRWEP
jgi:hypothetical protein